VCPPNQFIKEKKRMSTQTITPNEYRMIPFEQLELSPTNPRKRVDEAALNELAQSITVKGVMQPLLVRPLEGTRFQVVFGKRRFLAAQIAKSKAAPCHVRTMTDAEVIEAQITENLQRQDIHPLEEAGGFRSLLELNDPSYTVAAIAAKTGKSEAYVQGRIKLTELIPPIADAFLQDRIGIGHALLIARLPQSRQEEAFNAAFREMYTNGRNTPVLVPVRELAAWVETNILLELASAPFAKNDDTLLPEAGSCVNCSKRTGFNALLFPDVRKDSCLDGQCFRAKIERHVAKAIEKKPELVQISTTAWASRDGAPLGRSRYVELELKKSKPQGATVKLSPSQKPCEKMTDAIVTEGGNRGHVVKVCADPSCRVHHAKQPSALETARTRAEERKRMEKEKLAITVRHRVLAEVLKRVGSPLKRGDLVTIAQYAIRSLPFNQEARMAKRHKLDTENGATSGKPGLLKLAVAQDEGQLSKLLLEISLLDSAYQLPSKDADDPLLGVAKRYRLDVERIQNAVAQEFAAKRDKKEAKDKKSAKKATAPTAA
jgi:ParB family chromosome partitioning protein